MGLAQAQHLPPQKKKKKTEPPALHERVTTESPINGFCYQELFNAQCRLNTLRFGLEWDSRAVNARSGWNKDLVTV